MDDYTYYFTLDFVYLKVIFAYFIEQFFWFSYLFKFDSMSLLDKYPQ